MGEDVREAGVRQPSLGAARRCLQDAVARRTHALDSVPPERRLAHARRPGDDERGGPALHALGEACERVELRCAADDVEPALHSAEP